MALTSDLVGLELNVRCPGNLDDRYDLIGAEFNLAYRGKGTHL